MAERPGRSNGSGRTVGLDWLFRQPAAVCLFVAACLYVLFEPRFRGAFPGDRASPFRRRLVGTASTILRAHFDAFALDGASVYSDRGTGDEDLSLDAREEPKA